MIGPPSSAFTADAASGSSPSLVPTKNLPLSSSRRSRTSWPLSDRAAAIVYWRPSGGGSSELTLIPSIASCFEITWPVDSFVKATLTV